MKRCSLNFQKENEIKYQRLEQSAKRTLSSRLLLLHAEDEEYDNNDDKSYHTTDLFYIQLVSRASCELDWCQRQLNSFSRSGTSTFLTIL